MCLLRKARRRSLLGTASEPPWRKAIPRHKTTDQTPGLNTKGRAQSRNYVFNTHRKNRTGKSGIPIAELTNRKMIKQQRKEPRALVKRLACRAQQAVSSWDYKKGRKPTIQSQ